MFIGATEINLTELATLIASVMAFVSTFGVVVYNIVHNRDEKIKSHASVISKERAVWINTTRELVSTLCAFCETHKGETYEELSAEEKKEYSRTKCGLMLRLSSQDFIKSWESRWKKELDCLDDKTGKRAKAIVKKMHKYDRDKMLIKILSKDFAYVCKNTDAVRDLFTSICKEEWDRIRAEAGDDKNVEKRVAANINAFNSYYDNKQYDDE